MRSTAQSAVIIHVNINANLHMHILHILTHSINSKIICNTLIFKKYNVFIDMRINYFKSKSNIGPTFKR